ncbi:glutamate-5-semialdehyde dehydrogenase [Clavibacter michiganensis]|uniref:Gamma-glutamyl phosphate reductase n=1 Tax=Clavibacter michiganensis subsp. insidiosus TaxID=33014 RepID=A0A0D5CHS2_9MICO|nr:glutamate-5-semialdehyde dehydrogenase [Clavibacter michiganensis]AJW78844.1 gamma-glutamyl phosphate reductase [Clavibacter michiganensis subsp. insidiosus]AWF98492.1 gamma-glutamyl-phosphate reductase [Clavibacter michiganensis subsp. insidiosus]
MPSNASGAPDTVPADPTTSPADALERILEAARAASTDLAATTSGRRDAALDAIATALVAGADRIIAANAEDLGAGRSSGLAAGLLDRLTLDARRVASLADAVSGIRGLDDPLGHVVRGRTLPNGLLLSQVRVPFGVVGAIYEARPNVTVDIAALALKSGNAVVLRGGSAALRTNAVLVDLMRGALERAGLPADAVQTVDAHGRAGAARLMRARGLVDVLVPRGSAELIRTVVEESTVPVIETGAGVVHVYLDASADARMAVDIAVDAKVSRPSVCNAMETLLVHRDAAPRILPSVLDALRDRGVTVHGDSAVRDLWPDAAPATDEDWAAEYLSLDVAVRVVDSVEDAVAHIARWSTHHTESIVTFDLAVAERFLAAVDSAVVMVNASTRFTDGSEFGFGAEVGISTQKLHARGPMGLAELTSTKWIVRGSGQIRG